MYVDLTINPYEVKQTQQLCCNLVPNRQFKVLTIGKDSYIVKAKVETGLDMDSKINQNAGVYNLQIGKYSSLAEDVLFMIDINHDYLSVTQGCVSELKDISAEMKIKRKGQILIENDVWVGHGVTIMNGVTIHNGAVVAANSTVTKDVPPYAIVAGNPAKIVKYRFSENTINKLLKISWWNWSSETITERSEDFKGTISNFVEKYYEEAEEEYCNSLLLENPVVTMGSGDKYLLVPDFTDSYLLYLKIIQEFCKHFDKTENQLVIYLEPENVEGGFKIISRVLEEFEEYTVYIQIIDGTTCNIEQVISNVDRYITDRSIHTMYRVELAERYNIEIISGVDIPVFTQ